MKHIKLLAIFALVASFQTINVTAAPVNAAKQLSLDEVNATVAKIIAADKQSDGNIIVRNKTQALDAFATILNINTQDLRDGFIDHEVINLAIAALNNKTDFKTEAEFVKYEPALKHEVTEFQRAHHLLREKVQQARHPFFDHFNTDKDIERTYCDKVSKAFHECYSKEDAKKIEHTLGSKMIDVCSVLHPKTK